MRRTPGNHEYELISGESYQRKLSYSRAVQEENASFSQSLEQLERNPVPMASEWRKLLYVHYLEAMTLCLAGVCWIFAAQQLSEAIYEQGGVMDCVLFGNWSLKKTEEGKIVLDAKISGAQKHCSLVMFGFAGIGVVAAVFGWMFFFISPNQKAFNYEKTSLVPDLMPLAAIVSVTVLIFACVAGAVFVNGMKAWCSSMTPIISSCLRSKEILEFSKQLDYYPARPVLHFIIVAQVLVWSGVLMWLFNLILIAFRIILHLDFPSGLAVTPGAPAGEVGSPPDPSTVGVRSHISSLEPTQYSDSDSGLLNGDETQASLESSSANSPTSRSNRNRMTPV